MRLLTHNMLQCPRTKAHPLQLHAATCDDVAVPFSLPFIRRMLPRLHWAAFVAAASQLPDAPALARLPTESPDADTLDEPTARAIHRLLLEWHVVDGTLQAGDVCYSVRNGVPNLVITEVRSADGDGEHGEQDEGEEEEEGEEEGGEEAQRADGDAHMRADDGEREIRR